ncbi:hypothetical protein HRF10_12275 [Enterococcus faecalis]|nr:hypothetical protein [Enterococcus faecalis]
MKDIKIVKTQYQILLDKLIHYGDKSNIPQIKTIKYILNLLDSNPDMTQIKTINESLYTPRGGLGELYVWDDDYDKRIDLNEPIDKAKSITWEILMKD